MSKNISQTEINARRHALIDVAHKAAHLQQRVDQGTLDEMDELHNGNLFIDHEYKQLQDAFTPEELDHVESILEQEANLVIDRDKLMVLDLTPIYRPDEAMDYAKRNSQEILRDSYYDTICYLRGFLNELNATPVVYDDNNTEYRLPF